MTEETGMIPITKIIIDRKRRKGFWKLLIFSIKAPLLIHNYKKSLTFVGSALFRKICAHYEACLTACNIKAS